ncbi:MAG: hypothetical protein U0R68_02145 [Candidatus Nanopelagicales bacterium]
MNSTTARTALVVPVLATLALAGCASGSSSGGTTPSGTTPASSSVSAPSTSTPTSASPQSSTPEATTKSTSGPCSLIDESTAVSILGSPVKATPAQDIGTTTQDGDTATKLDGCLYKGTTGSIGYDVVKFQGADSALMFNAAKARAKAQLGSGSAKAFTSAVPNALAYTITLPLGTDSILSTVKDGWFITVSVSVKSKNPADSAGKVDAAAKALLGGI